MPTIYIMKAVNDTDYLTLATIADSVKTARQAFDQFLREETPELAFAPGDVDEIGPARYADAPLLTVEVIATGPLSELAPS